MDWLNKRKQDFFYKKAKAEKYRARSAYKLIEIQKKFHIIKVGDIIIDLGAAPGSWSQVALDFIGDNGKVLAVDMLEMAPLKGNFVFVKGDIFKERIIAKIKEVITQADVVISDAAPEFSGVRMLDIGRADTLCEQILEIAKQTLKKGGYFVCKSFQSAEHQKFIANVKKNFENVKEFKPAASLRESSEIYIIGIGFRRGKQQAS